MANFLLDFLQGAGKTINDYQNSAEQTVSNLPLIGGALHPLMEFGKEVQNTPRAIYREVQNKPIEDIQQQTFGTTDQGSIARQIIGNTTQAELNVGAPGLGKAIGKFAAPVTQGFADVGENVAGRFGAKILGGAAKGAVQGAGIGGAFGVAQGVGSNQELNAKNLTMDFLQGAGQGAEQGAVFGAASSPKAPFTPTDMAAPASIFTRKAQQFSGALLDDETAADIAKSHNPAEIEKKLEPVVGPAVAKDVAPSLAHTEAKDPNVVQNMVKNDIANKTLPSVPADAQPIPDVPGYRMDKMGNIYKPDGTPGTLGDLQTAGQNARGDNYLSEYEQARIEGDTATQQRIASEHPDDARVQLPSEEPFLNAPGEKNATGVSKASALQGAQDIFNQGGTVDEAMNHYMEQTGATTGEARLAVSKFINEASPESLQKGKINASLNPRFEEAQKTIGEVQPGDHEQAIKNGQTVHNQIIREGNKALQAVDQLSPADLKLMDQLRESTPEALASQAEDRESFLQAARAAKSYNDLVHGLGSAVGQEVPYRQKYGAPLLFDNTPGSSTEAAIAKLKTSPGYSKGRFFKNYDEAAQFGAQRRFDNFAQDLAHDISQRANDLSQLTLAKGLEEAYPGQVKVGQIGSTPEGTYKQLLIPGGSKISMPAGIASEINKRAIPDQTTGFWKGYDTLNSQYKSLKLAGGGFHSVNVMGTFIGQQLASGKFFTSQGMRDLGAVLRGTFSDNAYKSEMSRLGEQGTLLNADSAGLSYDLPSVEGDVKQGAIANKVPLLKQIHESIFGRQIPLLKLKTFEQLTNGLDRTNPDDLQKMSSIAKEINQNYGGLNRAIQGLTPGQFKLAARAFLATDYNEGQIRSVVDAFTKGGPEGKLARQVVFGKALLFAGLATAAGAAGGEFKGKDPKDVAFDILQKTVNPKFQFGNYTVGLPTTQLSELGKPLSQTVANAATGRSVANPIKDFLSARLAAVPSAVEQIAGNRNFSGQPIAGTDFYGRPISPLQTAENIAGMAAPIPIAQGIQTASGKQDVGAAVANIAGLNVRPTYDLSYAPVAGQTYVQALQDHNAPQAQIEADTQFYNLIGTLSKDRKNALNNAIGDIGKKDPQSAQKEINQFNVKLAKTLKPWVQSGGTKYLDATLLQQLRSSMISLSSANKFARTDIRNNPTAYGLPTSASSLDNQAQQSAASFANSNR